MAHHVTLDQLAVDLVVSDRVRAGADDAHASLQGIDELRQFVERSPAQEGAEAGDAPVVAGRLCDVMAVLADGHRAELVDDDLLAVQSVAPLAEQHRPRRRQFHADGDGRQQGRDQNEDEQRQDDVAAALDQSVHADEGRFADGHHRHAADLVHASLDQVGDENVRHEIDGSGRVAQVVEQGEDARLRGHRQRDVDLVDAVFLDEGGERADAAEQDLIRARRFKALARAVVEKACQADAEEGVAAQLAGQAQPGGAHAGDDRAALVALARQ